MPGLTTEAKTGIPSLVTQPDDFLVPDPMPSDLVIVVMGAYGSGKTTFINTLLNKGSGRPAGSHVRHHVFFHPQYPGHRILLVDTPSFGNRTISDSEVLRKIAVWLGESYRLGMKLVGLIHLHDISRERDASGYMDYEIFEKLCGKEGATKAVLATTMWDKTSEKEGGDRVKELTETWWSDMYDNGSSIREIKSMERTAMVIVESVLSHGFVGGIKIQRELVDKRLKLTDTAAYGHLLGLLGRTEVPMPQKGCC